MSSQTIPFEVGVENSVTPNVSVNFRIEFSDGSWVEVTSAPASCLKFKSMGGIADLRITIPESTFDPPKIVQTGD